MHRKVKLEKNGFDVALDGALESAPVIAIDDSLNDRYERALKGVLQDLYKDVPEGSFEVDFNGAI